MEDSEIKKWLKNRDENKYQLEVSATLYTIVDILIKNKITTSEEFEKIKETAFEYYLQQQIKNMTKEEKTQLEILKEFNDLFGGLDGNKEKDL